MSKTPTKQRAALGEDACIVRPLIDLPAAFVEHAGWLRVVALARLGERQAVEEVMQEAALAVVRQPAPSIDPSKLPAWLYRLVVRQSLLHRRRVGRHRRLMGRYQDLRERMDSSGEPDPLGWLLQEERSRLVREALSHLAPRDAEILMLKYMDDWTSPTLAQRLGTSTAAVEARLHRARLRLRILLAERDLAQPRSEARS